MMTVAGEILCSGDGKEKMAEVEGGLRRMFINDLVRGKGSSAHEGGVIVNAMRSMGFLG